MGVEYELKFRATPQVQEQILLDNPGPWQTVCMETTYYETPTGALSARHFTLRKRLENGKSVCTLKTPAQNGARGEWETECETIEQAIPVLCKLGGPEDLEALCREGLIPVCGARFTRKAGTLNFLDCSVELALDEGILFRGKTEVPLCEIEVEHKSGSREATDAFARQLADIYGLQPERKSKFARARALNQED